MKQREWKELAGINWIIYQGDDGTVTREQIQMLLLMEIRQELKQLNSLLHCSNFVAIPEILRTIKRNTTKKRKPRAVGKPSLRVVSR